jgi:fatty acid-binding protein DegV
MKTAELNDYLMYNGRLHKVTGVMTGKTLIMEPIIESEKNRMLGEYYPTIYVLEDSRNFQTMAEPIDTIQTKPKK